MPGITARTRFAPAALLVALAACVDGSGPDTPPLRAAAGQAPGAVDGAVFLLIDEESIDNGNLPNVFSDVDVNDQVADLGMREQLRYFREHTGATIDLFTGQVGDEGWFALKTIPGSWKTAGPTDNGTRNYLLAGPGLGAAHPDDDREVLLDKIPDVTPLRATGLAMLVGETACAVVYDSDVSINYSPLTGNLMGANLGIVAFEVLEVRRLRGYSTSSLPRVTIRIADPDAVCNGALWLFVNAPVPASSSEPFDIDPPAAPPVAEFGAAP